MAPSYPNLCPRYAVIDLETTGATATADHITEIAIVRVENGLEVARYSQLVNPGVPISYFIQRLTGISNALVAQAPRFDEVAQEVMALLDGCVIVAHNVRFDHSFLKNEFARLDMDWRVKTLCTVRLSRRLYPQFNSHGLDALMQRHGLTTASRHRAMGDVEVLLAWLQQVEQQLGADALLQAASALLAGSSSIPSHLETPLHTLPQGPGVYTFYGESALPLYIGKSVQIRTRVMSHFQADHKSSKELRMAQEVRRIECSTTAGELGALLLESRLVKQFQPVYNQQLRRQNQLCGWVLAPHPQAKPLVQLMGLDATIDPATDHFYGPFRSKRQALDLLRELAETHLLCPQALGLESGKGRCFAHQVGQCRGVCCGQESPALHHARVKVALSAHKLAQWPFDGVIGLREFDPVHDRTDLHLFHHWCHLATVRNESELEATLAGPITPLAFDLDVYKLLSKTLTKPAHARHIVKISAPRITAEHPGAAIIGP